MAKLTFEQVWSDPDVQAILRKVSLMFCRQLSEHDLLSCAGEAVIKVLRYYDSEHPNATKLTTAVFRAMLQVCRNFWDTEKRSRRRQTQAAQREADRYRLRSRDEWEDASGVTAPDVDAILSLIQPAYANVLRLYFFGDLTVEELAVKLELSPRAAERQLQCALETARFAAQELSA